MEFDYDVWYESNKVKLSRGTVSIRDLMLQLSGKGLITPAKREEILVEHGEDIKCELLYDHLVRRGVESVPDIIYCLERSGNGHMAKLFRDGVPTPLQSQQTTGGAGPCTDVWMAKQDALARSCNGAMLGLLLQKRDHWIPANNSTVKLFKAAHPRNNTWTDDERSKVLSPDFQHFDMSMTAKWLQEFNWLPNEPALTPDQRTAVVGLCDLRNKSFHAGYGEVVRKDQFKRVCERARQNLETLGIALTTIDGIIVEALA